MDTLTTPNLQGHLKLVIPWLNWCNTKKINPLTATHKDFCDWGVEHLALQPLPFRQATQNAVAEWYRDYQNIDPNPVSVNPFPYPLLTRYVEFTFEEIFEKIKQMEPEDRVRHLVLLFGYCKQDVLVQATWRVKGNFLEVEGRSIPITNQVRDWLIPVKTAKSWRPKIPSAVMQSALFVELNQIPEVTRAGIWGRWSAMKFAKPKKSWLFRVDLVV